jgi:predicted acylesterase/phospholipase RssA
MDEGALERLTEAFVQGAAHMAKQGASTQMIVNAMIGALVTVCYAGKEDPGALAGAFKRLARQIPDLYNKHDQMMKQKGRPN